MTKDEFHMLLKEAKLNKKEFSELSKVPYPTVISWGVARKGVVLNIPDWVEVFLEYYIKAKKFDYIKSAVCGVVK